MIIDDIRNRKNMTIYEALLYGYSIFRANIIQIMYIVFIIYFPLNLANGYISVMLSSLETRLNINEILSSQESMISFIQSAQYVELIKNNLISFVLGAFLAPFGTMAVIYIVKNYCEQKESGYKEALTASFSCGGKFIVIRLIYCICTGMLYTLGVIPGVILAVFWYFNIQSIILDGKSVREALSYSRMLVSGRWFKTLLVAFAFNSIIYGISYITSFLFAWGSNTYLAVVLFQTLMSIITTIFISAETVLYINYQANIVDRGKVKSLPNNNQ